MNPTRTLGAILYHGETNPQSKPTQLDTQAEREKGAPAEVTWLARSHMVWIEATQASRDHHCSLEESYSSLLGLAMA